MSGSGALRPRPEDSLSRRSSDLARRVLSDLVPAPDTTLVVTRECAFALEAARLAGEPVVRVRDLAAGDEVLASGRVELVIIGRDVEGALSNRIGGLGGPPVLRWRADDRPCRLDPAIRREGETAITVSVRGATAAEEPPVHDEATYRALLARARRLGAWLAAEGQALAEGSGGELFVRGGRAAVLEDLDETIQYLVLRECVEVRTARDVPELLSGLEADPVDLVWVQECDSRLHPAAVWRRFVRTVSEGGVACVTWCGLSLPTIQPDMPHLITHLPFPISVPQFNGAVTMALQERKAWLLDRGLSASHLTATVEPDPYPAFWRPRVSPRSGA